MPDRDGDRGRRRRGARSGDRRPARRGPLARSSGCRRPRRSWRPPRPEAPAPGQLGGVDDDRLAERPEGQRRQADHHDRQRELAAPQGRGAVIPGGASAAATTWPPHAPSMWPPTTAASWTVQTRPGGSQPPVGVVERGPEQVPALLERVGDRDEDPLAVDQQVGQVVGDEVAERDRQQAGADRAEADRPGDREGEQRRRCPRNANSRTRLARRCPAPRTGRRRPGSATARRR